MFFYFCLFFSIDISHIPTQVGTEGGHFAYEDRINKDKTAFHPIDYAQNYIIHIIHNTAAELLMV